MDVTTSSFNYMRYMFTGSVLTLVSSRTVFTSKSEEKNSCQNIHFPLLIHLCIQILYFSILAVFSLFSKVVVLQHL